MQQVRVERSQIKDRSNLNPLTGYIAVEIEVCSREKHGIDSYLHIGSGDIEIEYDRKRIINEINKIRAYRWVNEADLRKFTNLITIEEYVDFQRLQEPVNARRIISIPGSSIKGNIRSRIELTLRPKEGRSISCLTYQTFLQREPIKGMRGWRHYRIWRHAVENPREPRCNATKWRNVCVVCNILGAPGLASLINIGTFYLKNPDIPVEKLEQRNERIIAAKPRTVFSGSITFRGLTTDELGLLMIGMGQKADGPSIVLIGKHKYITFAGRLMGRVVYNIKRVGIDSECSGEDGIKPGAVYEEGGVRDFIIECLNAADRKYGDYIEIIDEHSKAIEVNKT